MSSLTLELTNFRCHKEYKLVVEPNKIYHLTGDSGNGKTTILEAIYWCMYGTKGAKVAPLKSTSRTSTRVSLTLITQSHNVIMTRKTNSHNFQVKSGDLELDGETAQQFVNDTFGTSGLWIATSYLRQKSFNTFLKGSLGDKRRILNRIAFRHDTAENIDAMMDKVDRMVSASTTRREVIEKQFSAGLDAYLNEIDKSGVKIEDIENGVCEQIPDYEQQVSEVESRISEVQSAVNKSKACVDECARLAHVIGGKTLDECVAERIALNKDLILHRIADQRSLAEREVQSALTHAKLQHTSLEYTTDSLKSTRLMLKGCTDRLARMSPPVFEEIIEEEPAKPESIPYPALDAIPKPYSFDEIYKAQSLETEWSEMEKWCERMGVENTESSIHGELNDVTNKLFRLSAWKSKKTALEEARKEHAKDATLLEKFKSSIDEEYIDPIPGYNQRIQEQQTIIAECKSKVSQIDKALRVQYNVCPHCSGHVVITPKRTLEPVESFDRNEYTRELSKLRGIIDDAEKECARIRKLVCDAQSVQEHRRDTIRNIKHVEERMRTRVFNEPDSVSDIENTFEELNKRLSELKRWKRVELPPVSSQQMKLMAEAHEKVRKHTETVKELEQAYKKAMDGYNGRVRRRQAEIQRGMKNYEDDVKREKELHADIEQRIRELERDVIIKTNVVHDADDQVEKAQHVMNNIECVVRPQKSVEEIYRDLARMDEIERCVSRMKELTESTRYTMYEKRVARVQSLTKRLDDLRSRIAYLNRCAMITKQRDALQKVRMELDACQKRELKAIELRDGMVMIQHARFALSTSRIGDLLSTIVSEIYSKPISVSLKMFKTIKAGKRTKPSVNLHITMDNEEIDPSVISGGEEDRLSIALTLALSKVHNSPLLLMDECFASLPAKDREMTINSIVRHGKAQDRFFFCIAPNSASGWFEKEIAV